MASAMRRANLSAFHDRAGTFHPRFVVIVARPQEFPDAMPAFRPVALTVLAVLAACVQAQTASPPRQGTRDDYRQCRDTEDKLKVEDASVRQKVARHQGALRQFQQEMQALVELQKTVDKTDENAVLAFNAQIDALNSRVDDINREGVQHQATIEELNERMYAHNKRCAGLVFRIVDIQAVDKERAAAAKVRAGKAL